jgi:hypothetical protein
MNWAVSIPNGSGIVWAGIAIVFIVYIWIMFIKYD